MEYAKDEVRPHVEKEYQENVDELLKMELECMKILAGIKKKKKNKKKKKKKKAKKKNIKLPGYKEIRDMDKRDVLVQLIQENIVKRLPPQKLTDFIGEFNYLHSMLDDVTECIYDPSMALIR